ncbi:MAG: alkaline phosphatase D family protein [Bacteroidia bacterium]|nr:alkaline phosphatase D family protein [Bacteroidia bacterium]
MKKYLFNINKQLFVFFGIILFSTKAYTQNNRLILEPCMEPFYHGVASGDPLADRVIIWTRITPTINQTGSILVNWKIALDTGMQNIINNGSLFTNSTVDYTVKVDVTNLQPNTYYYYEFESDGKHSVRGRTKTAPNTNNDSARFAIVSCANFEAGFFNVYKNIVQRNDIDAVICLGDYIYEYETGGYSPNTTANRTWEPANEIISIADYRMRYSVYHLDEDLRKCHQQYPFIVIWDDHESANDAWLNGAENHTNGTEGNWLTRKNAAKQAYFEWLPIRQANGNDPYQIFRHIQYGNLLDLIMLDTRLHGRDVQAGTTGTTVNSTTRQLLGTDQFTWLGNRLDSSNCQWKILAQQVMMAPLKILGTAINDDQWDGYPAERNRVFNHIISNNINNVVVLTGDIHSSWANDLPLSGYNGTTGANSAGVEFVTPSVTSPGITIPGGATAIQLSNSHIKYADLNQHGFILLTVTSQKTQADWYYVNTIDFSTAVATSTKSYYVNNNERFLRNSTIAMQASSTITNTLQAPPCPRPNTVTSIYSQGQNVILSIYPNPAISEIYFQYSILQSGNAIFSVYDINGKSIQINLSEYVSDGIHIGKIDVSQLSAGMYLLVIENGNSKTEKKFIKQ